MKKPSGLSILGLLVAAGFARRGLLTSLLSSNYLPHRYCHQLLRLRAAPSLVLHAIGQGGS
jgi:hypothetical protein